MKLKGTSAKKSTSRTRTPRSIEFKLDVARLKIIDKKSVKDSLVEACRLHDQEVTPGMLTAPHSFWSMYEKTINAKAEAGDDTVCNFLTEHGIGEDTPAPEATDAVEDAQAVVDEDTNPDATDDDPDAEQGAEEFVNAIDNDDNDDDGYDN